MAEAREFRASDLKRAGPVLGAAQRGPVRILRRSTAFVLMEESRFRTILAEAADPRPKTLEALLAGYDAAETRASLGGWMEDAPSGREAL